MTGQWFDDDWDADLELPEATAAWWRHLTSKPTQPDTDPGQQP